MKNTLPCPAWVFSADSNVHRARDRSWFGDDYQTISSVLGVKHASASPGAAVIGIGTVELRVKRRPDARGAQSHGILRLRNVLHVPSCLCNVIGTPIAEEYVLRTGTGGVREITDKKGRAAGYFQPPDKPGRLQQLRLSGPPIGPRVGPSPFKPATSYKISAWWHDDDRRQVMRQLAKTAAGRKQAAARSSTASFDDEERAWIIKTYGNVWTFMRSHKLRGSSEEDAATARHIIRSFRAPGKASAAVPAPNGTDSGLGMDGSVAGSNGAVSAEADRYFGPAELAWVREKYGDGLSFMVSLRLKFSDANDGLRANRVAAILMAPATDKG
ncbi:hypothetical protein IF1G_01301 [Cordyceps javanica]|uniref:Uncharacterized protein n=1 Tax=Cordyceps javanica TaxID=43265 RepID=A0A545WBE0_9HYPO|nr:hypothetical protein IF1G_01301 [Cordyceps javanica]TQW11236.1 hypothetical protein IF2G_02178 [Cordyceps javanica]